MLHRILLSLIVAEMSVAHGIRYSGNISDSEFFTVRVSDRNAKDQFTALDKDLRMYEGTCMNSAHPK